MLDNPLFTMLILCCEPTKDVSNPIFASVYSSFPKEGLNRLNSLLLKVKFFAEKDMNGRIINSICPSNDFGFKLGLFCNFLAEQVK